MAPLCRGSGPVCATTWCCSLLGLGGGSAQPLAVSSRGAGDDPGPRTAKVSLLTSEGGGARDLTAEPLSLPGLADRIHQVGQGQLHMLGTRQVADSLGDHLDGCFEKQAQGRDDMTATWQEDPQARLLIMSQWKAPSAWLRTQPGLRRPLQAAKEAETEPSWG